MWRRMVQYYAHTHIHQGESESWGEYRAEGGGGHFWILLCKMSMSRKYCWLQDPGLHFSSRVIFGWWPSPFEKLTCVRTLMGWVWWHSGQLMPLILSQRREDYWVRGLQSERASGQAGLHRRKTKTKTNPKPTIKAKKTQTPNKPIYNLTWLSIKAHEGTGGGGGVRVKRYCVSG